MDEEKIFDEQPAAIEDDMFTDDREAEVENAFKAAAAKEAEDTGNAEHKGIQKKDAIRIAIVVVILVFVFFLRTIIAQ